MAKYIKPIKPLVKGITYIEQGLNELLLATRKRLSKSKQFESMFDVHIAREIKRILDATNKELDDEEALIALEEEAKKKADATNKALDKQTTHTHQSATTQNENHKKPEKSNSAHTHNGVNA